MGYQKQNFVDYPISDYTTLKADHLNHIEDGICSLYEETANALSKELPKNDLLNAAGDKVILSKLYTGGYYVLSTELSIEDLPADINYQPTALIVERFSAYESSNKFTRQVLGSVLKTVNTWYYRVCSHDGATWTDWQAFTPTVAQTIGSSETAVMSQKAITELSNAFPKSLSSKTIEDSNGNLILDLNTINEGGYYILDVDWTLTNLPTNMSYTPTALVVERLKSIKSEETPHFVKQSIGSVIQDVDTWYYRTCNVRGEWSSWAALAPRNGFNRKIDTQGKIPTEVTVNLDTIFTGGYYILDTKWQVEGYPEGTEQPSVLVVERLAPDAGNNFVKQTIGSCYKLVDTWYYRVTDIDGEWTNWKAITSPSITPVQKTGVSETAIMSQNAITTLGNGYPKSATGYLTIDDNGVKHITLSDITEGGYYVIDTNWRVSDLPAGVNQKEISGLHVERHSVTNGVSTGSRFVKQIAYSITGAITSQYWRVSNTHGNWTDWNLIGSGGDSYNNTYNNEIVTNVYTNTYNVTANPTITTDTNNFLASSGNTIDRTADIISVLNETGFCKLGPGKFYVANLHLPAETTLAGSGYKTEIILADSVTDGYAVRLNNYCTIKDLRITSASSISLSETIGTRHGVMYQGTYNQNSNAGGRHMTLSNLYIDNFTGGGITCYNTGYSTAAGINASNITITKCNVGINISYWSEYHRLTNVYCNGCYYGCINNGGNNVFVNCGFNSNKVGFVIDNSLGDKTNNAHGSAIGCTFNHQGGDNANPTYAIKIINSTPGYVFEGCQIFYGKTLIDRSNGIVFTGCNFGSAEKIEINSGGTVLYNGCVFGSAPRVTNTGNSYTTFANCYTRAGTKISI